MINRIFKSFMFFPGSIQQEVECDIYAANQIGSKAVCDVLTMAIEQEEKMDNKCDGEKVLSEGGIRRLCWSG